MGEDSTDPHRVLARNAACHQCRKRKLVSIDERDFYPSLPIPLPAQWYAQSTLLVLSCTDTS